MGIFFSCLVYLMFRVLLVPFDYIFPYVGKVFIFDLVEDMLYTTELEFLPFIWANNLKISCFHGVQ